MSEHDNKVTGVDATENPAPSTGRRRLVKGLIIGTPAIMTVRYGMAQTTASIPLRCTSIPAWDSFALANPNANKDDCPNLFPPED